MAAWLASWKLRGGLGFPLCVEKRGSGNEPRFPAWGAAERRAAHGDLESPEPGWGSEQPRDGGVGGEQPGLSKLSPYGTDGANSPAPSGRGYNNLNPER